MTTSSPPHLVEAEYQALVSRVRDAVISATPPGSVVLVASKGDDSLVSFPARQGWHFPRADNGSYAGYHPADSKAAVALLEDLRLQGAQYLVFPATAFWWLDHYDGLRAHIADHFSVVSQTEDAVVYMLMNESESPETDGPASVSSYVVQLRCYLAHLLPEDALVAVVSDGDPSLLALEQEAWPFPERSSGLSGAAPNGDSVLQDVLVLARKGVSFLVIPSVELSWIDQHPEFLRALEARCQLVARQEYLCAVFDITECGGDEA